MSSIANGDQVFCNTRCHHSRNLSDLFRTRTELTQGSVLACTTPTGILRGTFDALLSPAFKLAYAWFRPKASVV